MDLNRLRLEEKIAGGAAILLFIDLFLNWYGSSVANSAINQAKAAAAAAGVSIPSISGVSADVSGWTIFSYTDLWILLLVVVTLAALALRATSNESMLPVPLSGIAGALSVWVAVLVIYRVIINKPGPGGVGISADFAAYLGIVFALILATQWVRVAMSEGSFDELASRASAMTSGGGGSAAAPPAAPAAPPSAAAPPPPAAPPPAASAPPVPPAPPGPPPPPVGGPPRPPGS